MSEKKYFWLKLKRNFYTRHDFRRIRARGGSDAALLYLMMMMESIDHEATLRYSEHTPYDTETLADVFGMDEETVARSLEILQDAEVVTIDDDGTIFLPECLPLIGSETEAAERMRNTRSKKGAEAKLIELAAHSV